MTSQTYPAERETTHQRRSAPLAGVGLLGQVDGSTIARVVATAIAPDGVRGWRLRPRGDVIELLVDPQRLAAGAPERRLVAIAAGAALYSLRLAVMHVGYEPVTELWPGGRAGPVVAAVRLQSPVLRLSPTATRLDRDVSPLVGRRQVPLTRAVEALADAAAHEGAALFQVFDKAWRLRLIPAGQHGGQTGSLTRSRSTEPPSSAVVAVLGINEETIEDLVLAGQAMQRVVVEAASASLSAAASFAPLARRRQRLHLAELCAGALPQVVLELIGRTTAPVAM